MRTCCCQLKGLGNKLPFLWHLATKNKFFIKPLINMRLWAASGKTDCVQADLSLQQGSSNFSSWDPLHSEKLLKMLKRGRLDGSIDGYSLD